MLLAPIYVRGAHRVHDELRAVEEPRGNRAHQVHVGPVEDAHVMARLAEDARRVVAEEAIAQDEDAHDVIRTRRSWRSTTRSRCPTRGPRASPSRPAGRRARRRP